VEWMDAGGIWVTWKDAQGIWVTWNCRSRSEFLLCLSQK
jgi:hypothetical protein